MEKIDNRWIRWGILYVFGVSVLAGIINYVMPYSPGPFDNAPLWAFVFWGLCYIPVIVFPLFAGKNVSGFGFTVNPGFAVVSVFFLIFCGFVARGSPSDVSWATAATEAFARTGEEVLFRGFLFYLILEIFGNKRRPWLWAAILSSLLFTLVHTQTFQPTYFNQEDVSSNLILWWKIFERLLNVFVAGLAFALLRAWTKSILPGAIIHTMLQSGGLLAMPVVLLIYAVMVFWAFMRGERVFFGFEGQKGN